MSGLSQGAAGVQVFVDGRIVPVSEVRNEVKRLVALLEPVLILGMGLLVAFIIVSLLMPILNLYEFSF